MRFTLVWSVVAAVAVGLSACGGDSKPGATAEPSATATVAVPTVPAATATATPPATPSTAGLPGDIAAAIDAAGAKNSTRLESLISRTVGPCVVDPKPGILVPPSCPAGSAAGALVPALVIGNCPDDGVGYIDPAITYRIASFDPTFPDLFIGVVRLDGPVRLAAMWGAEKIFWLGFDADGKLIGAGGGGSCATFDLRPRLENATWLTGPAWSD